MVVRLLPLELSGAISRARGKVLIGPVDLKLDGAGITVVIGPNGSGKTSLLRMMHGIARLHSGAVSWNCDMVEARKHQAFVFQTPVMLQRSVLENLTYPLRLAKKPKQQAIMIAESWAAKIGLDNKLDQQATRLSGGERQKLALARALVRQPQVLFLDEPCAALDGTATRQIETLLQEVASTGVRLVMSTHDMGQAKRLASEVIFVLHGKVHEFSSAETFFVGPETPPAQAFLNGEIVE